MRLEEKNIFKDCLIINQITKDGLKIVNEEIKEKNIKMLSFLEKGLSKSRNRGLEKSEAEIILLTDDDVTFEKDLFNIVKEEFEKNPNIDILTFKYEKESGKYKKNYSKSEFIHDFSTIKKVSSIEIALKKENVIKNKVMYDENFGLGSKFATGEENIFLKDCLEKKIKIKYIPRVIAGHPNITSGLIFDDKSFYSKGAAYYRLYGQISYLMGIPFIIRKIGIKNLFRTYSFWSKGIKDYIKIKGDSKN